MPLIYRADRAPTSELRELKREVQVAEGCILKSVLGGVRLASQWYSDAIRSSGADCFIKGWVALDILVPPSPGVFTKRANGFLQTTFPARGQEEIAAYVDWLYETRNSLFHDGVLPSSGVDATKTLLVIVQSCLRTAYGLPVTATLFEI